MVDPMNQGMIERTYLSILFFNPERLLEEQPVQLFEFPSHQKVLELMKRALEPDRTLNMGKLAEHPIEFEDLTLIMDLYVSGVQYEHYRAILMDRMKLRTLEHYMSLTKAGKMSLEGFVEKANNALKLVDAPPKQKTPEELAQMLTSKKSRLNFSRFQLFSKYLPIQEHTLTTIAAFTSRGKSAFALNLAHDLARGGRRVMYYNLEMTEEDIWRRLVEIDLQMRVSEIEAIQPGTPDYERIKKSIDYNGKFVVLNGTTDAESIRNQVIREPEEPVVFVDHVSYLRGAFGLKERERISESMKILNSIAKDGKATVFVLAQINRQGENEGNLSNLYGSSAIEQDSDNVIILDPDEDELQPDGRAKPELKMLAKAQKVRGGPKGTIKFLFRKPTQTFVERV